MIDVVGVGADGRLGPRERALVEAAEVLLGGPRHLADAPGDAEKVPWPTPLRAGLPALLDRYAGRRIVALASGDPLVAGIAATLIDLLGPGAVRVHPAVSSVALARARMGWPADTCAVVRVRGDDLTDLRRALAPGVRLIILSADETTPAAVAACLRDRAYAGSRLTVLGRLGADDETRVEFAADAAVPGDLPRLNVVAVEVAGPGTGAAAGTPGLPDELFPTTRGQLTKRHVRATALAMLAPRPGELLWDLGAGSGSVSIEWARSHPACRAVAVERDPERAALVAENAARLGAAGVRVVEGAALDRVSTLETPDAVFVGGGATRELIDAAYAALRPGGRLVVHAVTLETQALLVLARRDLGGDLFEIGIREAEPIGRYTGWVSARPVHQWVVAKPQEENA